MAKGYISGLGFFSFGMSLKHNHCLNWIANSFEETRLVINFLSIFSPITIKTAICTSTEAI